MDMNKRDSIFLLLIVVLSVAMVFGFLTLRAEIAALSEDTAAAPPVNTSDVTEEAGLSSLETQFEQKWAEQEEKWTAKLEEKAQALSNLAHQQMLDGDSADRGRPGVVEIPTSVSEADYRAGGQTAFGITHVYAVKGDKCLPDQIPPICRSISKHGKQVLLIAFTGGIIWFLTKRTPISAQMV